MNISDYTLVELRQLAKEKNIKNVSKLKKDELIEMLNPLVGANNPVTNNVEEREIKSEPSPQSVFLPWFYIDSRF